VVSRAACALGHAGKLSLLRLLLDVRARLKLWYRGMDQVLFSPDDYRLRRLAAIGLVSLPTRGLKSFAMRVSPTSFYRLLQAARRCALSISMQIFASC
jgi:hypothetical protein